MKTLKSLLKRGTAALLSLLMLLSLCTVGILTTSVGAEPDPEPFDPITAEIASLRVGLTQKAIMVDEVEKYRISAAFVGEPVPEATLEYKTGEAEFIDLPEYLDAPLGDGDQVKVSFGGMSFLFDAASVTDLDVTDQVNYPFTVGLPDTYHFDAEAISSNCVEAAGVLGENDSVVLAYQGLPVSFLLSGSGAEKTTKTIAEERTLMAVRATEPIFGDVGRQVTLYAVLYDETNEVVYGRQALTLTLNPITLSGVTFTGFGEGETTVIGEKTFVYSAKDAVTAGFSFPKPADWSDAVKAHLGDAVSYTKDGLYGSGPLAIDNLNDESDTVTFNAILSGLTESGTDGVYAISCGDGTGSFIRHTAKPVISSVEVSDNRKNVTVTATASYGTGESAITLPTTTTVSYTHVSWGGSESTVGSADSNDATHTFSIPNRIDTKNVSGFYVDLVDALGNAAERYRKNELIAETGIWYDTVNSTGTHVDVGTAPTERYYSDSFKLTYLINATEVCAAFPVSVTVNGDTANQIAIPNSDWKAVSGTLMGVDFVFSDTAVTVAEGQINVVCDKLTSLEMNYPSNVYTGGCTTNFFNVFTAANALAIDDEAPTVTAEIVDGNGEATYLLKCINDVFYLVRSSEPESVSAEQGYSASAFTPVVRLTVTDPTFDAEAYGAEGSSGVYTKTFALSQIPTTGSVGGVSVQIPEITDALGHKVSLITLTANGVVTGSSELAEANDYEAALQEGYYTATFAIDRQVPTQTEPEPTPTPDVQEGNPEPTPEPEVSVEEDVPEESALDHTFKLNLPSASKYYTGASGVTFHKAEALTLKLKDLDDKTGAGISRVAYEYSGSDPDSASALVAVEPDSVTIESGAWKIPLTPASGVSGKVTLTLTIYDNVGNYRVCKYTFFVDTKAPLLGFTLPVTTPGAEHGPQVSQTKGSYRYYTYANAADASVTITLTEDNPDLSKVTVNYDKITDESTEAISTTFAALGAALKEGTTNVYEVVLAPEDGYSIAKIVVNAADQGGLEASAITSPVDEQNVADAYLLDTAAPVITVTVPTDEPAGSYDEGSGTTYFYVDEEDVVFTFTDRNLRTAEMSETAVEYTRVTTDENSSSAKDYKILLSNYNGSYYFNNVIDPSNPDPVVAVDPAAPKVNGETTYTVTLHLKVGDSISGIKAYANDDALNAAEAVELSDTFRVDNVAPEVVVNAPAGGLGPVNGILYFASSQTVTVTVADWNLDRTNSTVSYYKIVDGTRTDYAMNFADFFGTGETDESASLTDETVGKTALKLTLSVKEGELLGGLTVNAVDRSKLKTGNSDYADAGWCADTAVPEVTTRVGDETLRKGEQDGVSYYTEAQTAVVTLKDANIDPEKTEIRYEKVEKDKKTAYSFTLKEAISGSAKDDVTVTFAPQAQSMNQETTCTLTIPIPAGCYFSGLEIDAVDFAGNTPADTVKDGAKCVVDDALPEVDVRLPGSPDGSVGDTLYFKKDREVKITVKDLNLDRANSQIVYKLGAPGSETTYTFRFDGSFADGEDSSVSFEVKNEEAVNEANTYVLVIPVTAGTRFTALASSVTDYAGNSDVQGDAHTYIADNTAPEITVTLPEESDAANSLGKTFYYNAEQTVTVRVSDANLDPANTFVSYTLAENGKAESVKFAFDSEASDLFTRPVTDRENVTNEYVLTIPVPDGAELSALKVSAADYATNTSDAGSDKVFVVDTTAPEITVKVDGQIAEYFLRGGRIHIKADETVKGLSGLRLTDTKEVSVEITVKDKNLSKNAEEGFAQDYYVLNHRSNGIAWAGSVKKDQGDTVLTYTDSVTVKADESGTLLLNLSVCDLAGNLPAGYTLANDTAAFQALDQAGKDSLQALFESGLTMADGKLAGAVVLDRARPLSDSDENSAPVIELTPSTNKIGSTAFSVNTVNWADGGTSLLYSGDMSYHLKVYDPTFADADGNPVCSGLKSVAWEIKSYTTAQNVTVVTSGDQAKASVSYDEEEVDSVEFNIPVKMLGAGESDDIVLRITAIDNAGNEIYYVQRLAIDKLAPRVTVSYDNNAVENEKYFKANRTLTVTVDELNFDPNTFSADRVSGTSFSTEPVFSGWTQSGSVWTATASYAADGDYTFAFATTDRAGNAAEVDYTNGGRNAAPREFTVDKTVPVITITFDNNSFLNGRYFKADRTATVTINEHNFRASDVTASVTANLDGSPITVPAMSGFTSAGNVRTATIPFLEDGDYTLQVQYTDLAGNVARIETVDLFTIDKTDPTIEITGLDNMAAYAGAIAPMITFGDVNIDPNGYSVTWTVTRLTGLATLNPEQEGAVDLTQHNSVIYSLNNPAETTENDGIYVLSAEITDLAGNSFSTDIYTYSVNRFGSVYTVEDEAMAALLSGGYTNEAPALTVFETNTDALTNQTVTLSINGTTLTLEEGVHYTVTAVNDGGSWHRYRYDILPEAFMKDGEPLQGEYEITVSSEDKAGNKNSNRTNVEENALALTFTLDNEAATGYVDVTGLGEGKNTLKAAETAVTAYWEDNIGLAKVEIYLNDVLVKTLEGEELAAAGGQYTFTVTESNDEQLVRVVLTDAAGNVSENSSTSFYLNSSAFRHFLHNTPLFIISCVVLAAVIVLIIVLARKSKKQPKRGGK